MSIYLQCINASHSWEVSRVLSQSFMIYNKHQCEIDISMQKTRWSLQIFLNSKKQVFFKLNFPFEETIAFVIFRFGNVPGSERLNRKTYQKGKTTRKNACPEFATGKWIFFISSNGNHVVTWSHQPSDIFIFWLWGRGKPRWPFSGYGPGTPMEFTQQIGSRSYSNYKDENLPLVFFSCFFFFSFLVFFFQNLLVFTGGNV